MRIHAYLPQPIGSFSRCGGNLPGHFGPSRPRHAQTPGAIDGTAEAELRSLMAVDLIVVGNHKHHGLDRVFESLAGKVIDHTDRTCWSCACATRAGGEPPECSY